MLIAIAKRMRAMTCVVSLGVALSLASITINAKSLELKRSGDKEEKRQLVVKYRDGSSPSVSAAHLQQSLDRAARSVRSDGSLSLRAWRRMALGANVVRASRSLDAVEADMLLRQLRAQPEVLYAEMDAWVPAPQPLPAPDAAVRGSDARAPAPNDPQWSKHWHFQETGINLLPAWDRANGTGIRVAVIDTGSVPHGDLNANVLSGGYDFMSDPYYAGDGDGRDPDPSDPGDKFVANSTWHGTHVSGTIAAVTNNGIGVAGAAPKAKILPIRTLGKQGGASTDIADAIAWAAGEPTEGVPDNVQIVHVVNLSVGARKACQSYMQEAIDFAVSKGVTVVAAAGNDNGEVDNFMPANCDKVITVGAYGKDGKRAYFSNYGAKVDVAAPGMEVISTSNTGTDKPIPGGDTYKTHQGTSMASPHVAAVVALIQSAVKTPLTPAQVEAAIKASVRPFTTQPDKPVGAGYVDVAKAIEYVCRNGACDGSANQPPKAQFGFQANGLVVSFTNQSTDQDGRIASQAWDFGDGQASTDSSPSHTYAKAGTYTVKLTVKDDRGAEASTQQPVEVKEIPSGNELQNNVPVNVAGAQGSEVYYTLQLPEGQSRLAFTLKGGSGDADLYVRHGQKPTTSTYDCRPYKSGNDEVCEMTPKAGTWHVLVRGYRAFDGATLTASYAGGGGGTKTYANEDDVTIVDKQTVRSAIAVSGREGAKGQPATRINVAIAHTYIGDLTVSLQSPSGQRWVLHNRSGGSADDVRQAYTLDLSAESLEGEWVLLVADAANGDTGRIERWDITF